MLEVCHGSRTLENCLSSTESNERIWLCHIISLQRCLRSNSVNGTSDWRFIQHVFIIRLHDNATLFRFFRWTFSCKNEHVTCMRNSTARGTTSLDRSTRKYEKSIVFYRTPYLPDSIEIASLLASRVVVEVYGLLVSGYVSQPVAPPVFTTFTSNNKFSAKLVPFRCQNSTKVYLWDEILKKPTFLPR